MPVRYIRISTDSGWRGARHAPFLRRIRGGVAVCRCRFFLPVDDVVVVMTVVVVVAVVVVAEVVVVVVVVVLWMHAWWSPQQIA